MPLLKVVVSSTRTMNETEVPVETDTDADSSASSRLQSAREDPESMENNQFIEPSQEENLSSPLLSATSSLSKKGSIAAQDICRICHCEAEPDAPLVEPCCCSGSLRYVHQGCLQRWVQSSDTRNCELCKYPFVMQTKIKPFKEWEKLDMSAMERRKLACSVTFHAVAFTCVVWSLYVLIDRSAEEYSSGQLQWPFWTKLVVVAIGFTGGVVFMYVQCTMYVALCRRWRAYNRIILVQNAPNRVNPSVTTVNENTGTNSLWAGKRKIDKKPTTPVHSVVTIAAAFSGTSIRCKIGTMADTSDNAQYVIGSSVANDSHSEEMAALLDLKIQPQPSTSQSQASF